MPDEQQITHLLRPAEGLSSLSSDARCHPIRGIRQSGARAAYPMTRKRGETG